MRGHGCYPPGTVPSSLCHPAWDTSNHTVGAQAHPERVARALAGREHGPVPQLCPHPTAWPSPSAFPHCPRGSRELGGLPWGQLCLQAAQAGTSWGGTGHGDTRDKRAAPGAEMAARDNALAKGRDGDYCSIGPTSGGGGKVSAHGDLGFKGFSTGTAMPQGSLCTNWGYSRWTMLTGERECAQDMGLGTIKLQALLCWHRGATGPSGACPSSPSVPRCPPAVTFSLPFPRWEPAVGRPLFCRAGTVPSFHPLLH